jgi:hypothetical protein
MIEENEESELDIGERSLRQGNVSLVLDSYNDIFSDFDPRDYFEKALSDDFLIECKKAARDKGVGFELRLLVPRLKRNLKHEVQIKKRLKLHFQKHYIEKRTEIKNFKRQGIVWFLIGTGLMLFSTFLYNTQGFLFDLLKVMAEPAGWFAFWEGLYKVLITAKEKEPEVDFYNKMATAQIYFLSY